MDIDKDNIDIAAIGYPAVRQAFNDVLQLCIDKLVKAEMRLAEDILDVGVLDEDTHGFREMLSDTSLYPRKGTPSARKAKQRIEVGF